MPTWQTLAAEPSRRFKIGACDWSLGCRQQLSALAMAKRIGLDGVQVSFGAVGGRYDLRRPAVRREYLDGCRRLHIEIASLAMGILNSRPYASDPEAERWVADCVEVLPKMNQRIVLVAFFGKGDIKDKPAAQKEVIRRLRRVAPRAERAGVVLGIESWLDAATHLRILDAVGSPAVQVYYDVANMHESGYDICAEIRRLGRQRICQIHAKENGFLLGQGKIDFPRVRRALDEIGWHGWLVIEGATVPGKSIEQCYRHNLQYLRRVFA